MKYKYSRNELYEMVWSEPVSAIAPRIGISDTAVRKACQKAKIPRPAAGYWAKKRAGKKLRKLPLPPRFPGMHDYVIFQKNYNYQFERENEDLDTPIPPLPEWEEGLDSLRKRVITMVGKVSYPTLTNRPHHIIDKLLQRDDLWRQALLKDRWSWDKPLFDSPMERRRLRLLNAIFLAARKVGCKPNMSTSKYDTDNREASLHIGDQSVSFILQEPKPTGRGPKKSPGKKTLVLEIRSHSRGDVPGHTWKDTDETRLESHLTEIMVEIIMTAEIQYREGVKWSHEWDVQHRQKELEKRDQKRLEEERLAREIKEQQEQARIEQLLSEANGIQQAKVIRDYVRNVRDRINEISKPKEEIERWVQWALEQADRIDPIKSGQFVCK